LAGERWDKNVKVEISMTLNKKELTLDFLRTQTMGNCYKFKTPFGVRYMTYADYIASGRNLKFIEDYLLNIQEAYANTHTEDDITGKSTTELLHLAEEYIKKACGGNKNTRVISTGTGATGAIKVLQEILGIHIPPVTKDALKNYLDGMRNDSLEPSELENFDSYLDRFTEYFDSQKPVIFVSSYEHHSNEVTWREGFAEVVTVGLTPDGLFDLADLEAKVSDSRYAHRMKVGSFSAGSNVTGLRTPVYDIARIMHRHDGIVAFDFAASAPYIEINMNKDEQSYFDAIFVSPHKFLGGPGATGLLLFNKNIYRKDLPPTCGGGGTVDYVSPHGHDFTDQIEQREKPGTPGTLQVIKAALAFEVKETIGVEKIEELEGDFITRAMQRLGANPNVHILGNQDPDQRISILSFNIRHGDKVLHPKFVTRLINDLFGIQSRAGCSCAGPYGHALLNIGSDVSESYRCSITKGFNGVKPGWVRVGFHFTLSETDFDFIIKAIEFIAEKGYLFLPVYKFDVHSGTWSHVEDNTDFHPDFGLEHALCSTAVYKAINNECERQVDYESYLKEADDIAESLKDHIHKYITLDEQVEELRFFEVIHLS
jgi:selenocysteine lyase/cysteine desulfurase